MVIFLRAHCCLCHLYFSGKGHSHNHPCPRSTIVHIPLISTKYVWIPIRPWFLVFNIREKDWCSLLLSMCFQSWYIADSALHSSCWHFCIALLRSTFQLTCTPSAALHLQWGILPEIFKKTPTGEISINRQTSWHLRPQPGGWSGLRPSRGWRPAPCVPLIPYHRLENRQEMMVFTSSLSIT